jgi:hypothetical protein
MIRCRRRPPKEPAARRITAEQTTIENRGGRADAERERKPGHRARPPVGRAASRLTQDAPEEIDLVGAIFVENGLICGCGRCITDYNYSIFHALA